MDTTEIKKFIVSTLVEKYDVGPLVEVDTLTISQTGNMDSLDMAQLAMDLEDHYSVEILLTDVAKWERVTDIVECVVSKLTEKLSTMKTKVEEWAKNVATVPLRPLTPEEMSDFIKCYVNEEHLDKDEELLKVLEGKDSMASVLWLRVKHCHTYEITPSLCLFLGTLIPNFGVSTMMANHLQYIAFIRKTKRIDLDTWAKGVFPLGVPTEEGWRTLWDLQKSPEGYNILDNSEYMQSISVIE